MSNTFDANVDYYAVLELSQNASSEEIIASHRRLIRLWHPDRHADPAEATRMSKVINVARDVLLDPQTRREYDQARGSSSTRASSAAPPSAPRGGPPPPGSEPYPETRSLDLGKYAPGDAGDEFVVRIFALNASPRTVKISPIAGRRFWEQRILGPEGDEILTLAVKADVPHDIRPGIHTDSINIDFDGRVATIEVRLEVIASPKARSVRPDRPPVISATAKVVGAVASVDVTGTFSSIELVFEFLWGDGARSTSSEHTYRRSGSYRIEVRATNSAGTTTLIIPSVVAVVEAHEKLKSEIADTRRVLTANDGKPLRWTFLWLLMVPVAWPGLASLVLLRVHGAEPSGILAVSIPLAAGGLLFVGILTSRKLRRDQHRSGLTRKLDSLTAQERTLK